MDLPANPISRVPSLTVLPALPSFMKPSKRIAKGEDISHFLTSLAYRDICVFVAQLNNSVCPRKRINQPIPETFALTDKSSSISSIFTLQKLLDEISALIQQAPPHPGPRRFGNISFRQWHTLLEANITTLLSSGSLGQTLNADDGRAREEIASYLLGSFGSAERLDYGTGHELSFIAFLGCLWKIGYFEEDSRGAGAGGIEREIVLQVIEPYLRVVRKLILTYNLEPAGSHGVWGLDDHSFIPYIFGSAQFTKPINDSEPTPLEGSVRGAPKPSTVVNSQSVEQYRSTNMYFAAVGFINDVKKGPFWEHSPMLFDISGIKDGWGKINKGMLKMFDAEVLSKFPVVQHFPFGSLFTWDADPEARAPEPSVHMTNQPLVAKSPSIVRSETTGTSVQRPREARPSGIGTGPETSTPTPSGNESLPFDRSQGNGGASAQTTGTRAPWAK